MVSQEWLNPILERWITKNSHLAELRIARLRNIFFSGVVRELKMSNKKRKVCLSK